MTDEAMSPLRRRTIDRTSLEDAPTAPKSAEVDGRIDRSGGTQRWSQISNGELRILILRGF
jgi:hypothetical protein